jgi:hypothetical protein
MVSHVGTGLKKNNAIFQVKTAWSSYMCVLLFLKHTTLNGKDNHAVCRI